MSQPTLLDQLRDALRIRHYSPRTEKTYVRWVVRFVRFHRLRHPAELDAQEIQDFLSYLATQRRVSASTQNQALSALVFMYRHVLGREIQDLELVRAKRTRRLPVVLTRQEVRTVLELLDWPPALVAGLLYGAGLRLLEGLRLRVKDLDFGRSELTVREGKGGKDRMTVLPVAIREPLRLHLRSVRLPHETDLHAGDGTVHLPDALARKYPCAAGAWGWQYVFPAPKRYRVRRSGRVYLHHLHESVVQKAVRRAVQRSGIEKPASCHTFGITSRPTFSKTATTSARSRSFWGTAMCGPP